MIDFKTPVQPACQFTVLASLKVSLCRRELLEEAKPEHDITQ